MKSLFNRHKAVLTTRERLEIWERVSSPRKARVAPWTWRLAPAAGLLVAGVVATILVLEQGEGVYSRRAAEAPVPAAGPASGSGPGQPETGMEHSLLNLPYAAPRQGDLRHEGTTVNERVDRTSGHDATKSGSAAEVAEGQATTALPATEATPPADRTTRNTPSPPEGPGVTSSPSLSTVEITARRELKAGVVVRDGELHYRGGRATEAQQQADGAPVGDPLVGGTAGAAQGGLDKEHGAADPKSGDITRMIALSAGKVETHRDDEVRRITGTRPQPIKKGQTEVAIAPMLPSPVPVIPNTGGSVLPNDEPYDAMYFDHAGVNPFITTEEDPLSTFAVDVDNASYTVARRYLELGNLPPADAIRVEEFVNFFPQGYPSFHGPDFRVFTEGAPSPFGDGYHLVRIGLKAREVEERDRRPAVLTFVVDVSGSMAREDRLGLVQRSLRMLVDRLRPGDVVGIVVYGSQAREVLRPTRVDDPTRRRYADARGFRHDDVRAPDPREEELDARWRILDAIDLLQPSGSTNAEDGLRLGYRMAREAYRPDASNRIILCSDGVANEGRTSAESILDEVRRRADEGIALTAVGVGMGNYNDVLMEKLADRGDGNYFYVDDLGEARRVFIENLTGTLETVAREVKVQVEFDPAKVSRYRLLGFENRDVADRDFRNDKVDAGEVGAGHEVTALYEVKLAKERPRGTLATVRLRWFPVDRNPGWERDGGRDDGHDGEDRAGERRVERDPRALAVEIAEPIEASDLRSRFRDASPHFQLDAAVAEFAEILRKSYWAKESRLEEVRRIAEPAARELGSEQAHELVRLIERAQQIEERDGRGGSWEDDEDRRR